MSELFEQFRGQWGGKTASGEEMWWSEPNPRLMRGSRSARLRFELDVRQHFLMRFLKKGIRGITHPKIVDFGCGTGGTTLNFSKALGQPIDGYDIFATQIVIANSQAKKNSILSSFGLLDSTGKFPLPDSSVDVLFSADVLGHVPEIASTLKEWHRVLKPGAMVALFTESSISPEDNSLMARLARQGHDMGLAVPEHISLFPREKLEEMFVHTDFEVLERYSANVLHWFFFPKDYVLLLQSANKRGGLYWASWVWNRLSKILPFYPVPLELIRLGLTHALGKKAYGSGYFYLLRKKLVNSASKT